GADVALATTGVAGPGGAEDVPVGTVCLGVAIGDDVVTTTVRLPGDRARGSQFAAIFAADLLRRQLLAREGVAAG
ncbi:MAG: CinA family protein, partial [Acidimicrobiia bacterium]